LVPEQVLTDAENLAPPEFDPRTVQPVASRYTDYVMPATFSISTRLKFSATPRELRTFTQHINTRHLQRSLFL
jgi:hypothetical protein